MLRHRTWHHSGILTSKNSRFQGHATRLTNDDFIPNTNNNTHTTSIQNVINELIQSDKSLQKASHPAITAWMYTQQSSNPANPGQSTHKSGMSSSGSVQLQGINDCGEAGAAMKLMYMLQKSEYQDVLVIVTRWYGGVPLGSSRFRYICNAGMEALRAMDDKKEEKGNDVGKTTTKKKKRGKE